MIEFIIPHKVTAKDGLNKVWAGVNPYVRAKWRDYWHMITKMSLANIPHRTLKSPVMFEFWFDSRLDLDGHAIIVKVVIDTLVENKWIVGDTRKHVQCIIYRFHDYGNTKVRVTEI
jgi:hypothetical protein